ncbi:SDR family oxidoreductase [Curvibacter sp. APW13]|uniref:SDR family oxidoreductase n=1 Tax=Curvibacter sp. APW13 TaxID=3077236 RepID=UPI0028DF5B53|nr:SDR family oxidoreductase [Curvibacter sp. APW13]MDT8990401.1 SDR family oxidoreductase [Curvibacter sp. APW13]
MSTSLAYITGASSGLGQALALRYYQAGYRLALVARRTEAVTDWARSQGLDTNRLAVYGADVSVIDSIVQAGQQCLVDQGIPDVVIACAGFSTGVDIRYREDLDVMARTFATNNVGTAATFHPFIAAMVARGTGALVGVASVHGIRGMPGHGAYCPSKAGVISFCESLRGELKASGVKVVTIVPGYIDTPLTQGNTYSMPFLMPASQFADAAYNAIDRGSSYRVIPWQMGVVAKFLRVLPNWAFDKLFAGRPRKPRSPT